MSVIALYVSWLRGAVGGTRPRRARVGHRRVPIFGGVFPFALVLLAAPGAGRGAETNAALPSPPSPIEATNLQQLLQACCRIEQQLHVMQLTAERNHQEAEEEATQNAAAVATGLQAFQETFSAQRARELEVLRWSNKTMLAGAGTLAAFGMLAMVVLTYFQWRTSNCLARLCAGLPAAAEASLDTELLAPGNPVDPSNRQLLGALEQLDQRIQEFKRAIGSNGNGDCASEPAVVSGEAEPGQGDAPRRIPVLLEEAQSLMNLGSTQAALALYDEVLAFDPNHTEALVKKGAALERLQKLNEAIECYDRAIAVDGSMTTAYLYKGGLYNRLERFKEALQCYEKALQAHDQRGS